MKAVKPVVLPEDPYDEPPSESWCPRFLEFGPVNFHLVRRSISVSTVSVLP